MLLSNRPPTLAMIAHPLMLPSTRDLANVLDGRKEMNTAVIAVVILTASIHQTRHAPAALPGESAGDVDRAVAAGPTGPAQVAGTSHRMMQLRHLLLPRDDALRVPMLVKGKLPLRLHAQPTKHLAPKLRRLHSRHQSLLP